MKESWYLCWDKLNECYIKMDDKKYKTYMKIFENDDSNHRYSILEKYDDEKGLDEIVNFFNEYRKTTNKKENEFNNDNKLEINKEKDKKVTNHPLRYGGDTVYETIKVLKNWVSKEEYRGFLLCNAIKYLSRLGKKDDEIQEIDKTMWYLNKLKESYQEEKSE